jgi:hypothetical protein
MSYMPPGQQPMQQLPNPQQFAAMNTADRSGPASQLASMGATGAGFTTPGLPSPGDYLGAQQQVMPFGQGPGGGAQAPYGMNSQGQPFQNAAPGFNYAPNAMNMPQQGQPGQGQPPGGMGGGMQGFLQMLMQHPGFQQMMQQRMGSMPGQMQQQQGGMGGGQMPQQFNPMQFQSNPMNPYGQQSGISSGGTPALQGYSGGQASALNNPNQGGYSPGNVTAPNEMSSPGISAFGQMGNALGGMMGGGTPRIPLAGQSQMYGGGGGAQTPYGF